MADRTAKAGASRTVTRGKAPGATGKASGAAAPAPLNEAIELQASEGTNEMTKENGKDNSVFASDRIQAVFGDVNERAKAAVEKGAKLLEEASELTKGNVEALVASSKVAAKGVESLSQEAAEYGRKSFEEASAALKSFAEAKSPTEFFKLQSDYARSAFDSLVAESSKVSEAVIKLAGEVAEPITSRYAVAAERVKTLAL